MITKVRMQTRQGPPRRRQRTKDQSYLGVLPRVPPIQERLCTRGPASKGHEQMEGTMECGKHTCPRADGSPGPGWHAAPHPDPNTGQVLALTSEIDSGFKVFLGPFYEVHLKTESDGPFISKFCEKSRSGTRTVKEMRILFFFFFWSDLRHW